MPGSHDSSTKPTETIAQVDAVFVAEGGEFHPHEGFERDEAEFYGVLALVDAGVGFGLVGTGLFFREDDRHGVADFSLRAFEEDIERAAVAGRGDAAMVEVVAIRKTCRGVPCRQRLVEVSFGEECPQRFSTYETGTNFSSAGDAGVANLMPATTFLPMSITVVVENDTIKLPPGVHVPDGTKAEIILPGGDEAGAPERVVGRAWSPEELGAAADQMVAEKSPVLAQAQWQRIVAGFYGDADA